MNNLITNNQVVLATALATASNFNQSFMYLAANLKITEGQTTNQSSC